MAILEEKKASADVNALKGLCIDHIGHITARLFRPLPNAYECRDGGPNLENPVSFNVSQATL